MCSTINNVYDYVSTSESNNNLFLMFYTAYNNHLSIVLNPNDIWQNMLNYFSFFVNNNSELVRHLLVKHTEGKIELEIIEIKGLTYKGEENWDFFFSCIIKEIQKNTQENVVDVLASNFSTANGNINNNVIIKNVF